MSCAPNAVKPKENRPRRSNLASKIDAADIDSKFQRSRRDQSADFSRFQFALRAESQLSRKATVMGRNSVASQSFRKMVRDTLGQPAGVYKNERRRMLVSEQRQPSVNFPPHFVG